MKLLRSALVIKDDQESAVLTSREHQILTHMIQGESRVEVAAALCVGKRTIDFHMMNIYGKLNVRNHMQALHSAVRLGLITRLV